MLLGPQGRTDDAAIGFSHRAAAGAEMRRHVCLGHTQRGGRRIGDDGLGGEGVADQRGDGCGVGRMWWDGGGNSSRRER